MKLLKITFLLLFVFIVSACGSKQGSFVTEQLTDSNGFIYKTVTNDPLGVRIYTLKNGLKVYLSQNKNEPRIQGYIAVKAGSKNDPKNTTGLAHYLEHMLFKGTSKFGTLNWEKEKALLDQISELYEKHLNTDEADKKKEIYREIDKISTQASKYAIANEYDKLTEMIGSKGTNAHTWYERTVYMNDFPKNEIERWMQIESERFSKLVLRLFHTEIETVYEEFNMSQDRDRDKVEDTLMANLFKKHTYGLQTTLGKAEHLKNPSMVNIHNYFNTYYVPNNMAICLSGDLDFEATMKLITKYWGGFDPNNNIPEFTFEPEEEIIKPIEKTVLGPEADYINFAYRFKGDNTRDHKIVTLIDMILNNSKAGLIDLNLVQKQKVLRAGCSALFLKDYGKHEFFGYPKEGQTLEQVRDLILAEIDKVKKGEFEEWLISAVINDMRLRDIQSQESNRRAYKFVEAFLRDVSWQERLSFFDELEKISKQEVIDFANSHYLNNYVIVYKKKGEDKNVVKVEKPKITAIKLNRTDESEYVKNMRKIETGKIEPVFVNFNQAIKESALDSDIKLHYIKNTSNDIFSLNYILDMGKDNDKKFALAVQYLKYIGTSKFSAADLNKEFFKHGLDMNVFTGPTRSYVTISGLTKSFEKGIELLDHVLADAKADKQAYQDFVKGILKKRKNAKLSKSAIMFQALWRYGEFGKESSFTDILSAEELNKVDPEELAVKLHEIPGLQHTVFYYGKHEMADVQDILNRLHKVPETLADYPPEKKFVQQDVDQPEVLFVNYDMVQTNLIMLTKGKPFERSILPLSRFYNEFYSSIFFQEIREAKGLAYSATSFVQTPRTKDMANMLLVYVATQPDKLEDAINTSLGLLNNLARDEKKFDTSKAAIMKKIETERIINDNIYWTYRRNLDLGIDYDYRKDIYDTVKDLTLAQLETFFKEHIYRNDYLFLILGNKAKVDFKKLTKFGKVRELTLEEIFNY